MTTLRLAIVGAGPAGIYAADNLLKVERKFDASIDLFDAMPAPYGLVRYGVAPDHPRIKGVIGALRDVIDHGDIRIFGNVLFGRDLDLDDLKAHYNAVIFTTGAIHDAPLPIPGIDAAGSFGAAQFVRWYDGHPDVPREWSLDASSVGVIGNGNVALDVSRFLAKHVEDLEPTEIPHNVHEGLAASRITDVHVFGRRGPMGVKFTPLELRELGELRDVDMVLYDEDFDYDDAARTAIKTNKQVFVLNRIMQAWRQLPSNNNAGGEASRRLHLHFWARPVEVKTDAAGRVSSLVYERTRLDDDGAVQGTGELREVPMGQLYRAIGWSGTPLPGVPFDKRHGVIPNREGRVLEQKSAEHVPGLYTSGWAKRGAVGLIGHTKSDAMETVRNLINDEATWWHPAHPEPDAIPALLRERGVVWTDLDGWHRLDAHEIALGAAEDRERVKVVPRDEMVRISRGE